MKNMITTIFFLIMVVTSLSCCTFLNDSEKSTKVIVEGEFSITNDNNWDGYREGVKLRITSLEPEDVVLDIGEVKAEVLDNTDEKVSTWYQGKIAELDFHEQVRFSNLYDCVGDKDTLDKGDYITFWFKENGGDYEPTLDGYTISLHWRGQKIFSKIVNISELRFDDNELVELPLSLQISSKNSTYIATQKKTIILDVILRNNGFVDYKIDNPTLHHQSLQIYVLTPNGKNVHFVLAVKSLPKPYIIESENPIELSIEIGGNGWNDDNNSFENTGFFFNESGNYSIQAFYESGRAENNHTEDCEIESNQISIQIMG